MWPCSRLIWRHDSASTAALRHAKRSCETKERKEDKWGSSDALALPNDHHAVIGGSQQRAVVPRPPHTRDRALEIGELGERGILRLGRTRIVSPMLWRLGRIIVAPRRFAQRMKIPQSHCVVCANGDAREAPFGKRKKRDEKDKKTGTAAAVREM